MRRSTVMAKRLLRVLCILPILALTSVPALGQGVDMILWVNAWPQAAMDAIQDAADVFASRHPMVNSVSVQPVGQNEVMARLAVGVVAGTPPDAVTMVAPFAQQAMTGLLQPLGKLIDQSAVISRGDYAPQMLGSFSLEGREYGIPAIENNVGLLLAYSKNLFEEAGLPDQGPDSLTELHDMHRKLTKMHSSGERLEQVGIKPLNAMGGFYYPLTWGTIFELDWYDESTHQLDLMQFESSIDYIQQIYDTPGFDLIDGTETGDWFAGMGSGRLAMQIDGSWLVGWLKNNTKDVEYGYTWAPNVKSDRRTAVTPWGIGIPVNAPHTDLSFELIEFLTTVEAQQIIFDAVGWINGNLTTIRALDITALPETAPIVQMLIDADFLNGPPPLPILNALYNAMSGQVISVLRGEQNARSMLETLQLEMQAKLDQVFADTN